jgi:hypothetical protein
MQERPDHHSKVDGKGDNPRRYSVGERLCTTSRTNPGRYRARIPPESSARTLLLRSDPGVAPLVGLLEQRGYTPLGEHDVCLVVALEDATVALKEIAELDVKPNKVALIPSPSLEREPYFVWDVFL